MEAEQKSRTGAVAQTNTPSKEIVELTLEKITPLIFILALCVIVFVVYRLYVINVITHGGGSGVVLAKEPKSKGGAKTSPPVEPSPVAEGGAGKTGGNKPCSPDDNRNFLKQEIKKTFGLRLGNFFEIKHKIKTNTESQGCKPDENNKSDKFLFYVGTAVATATGQAIGNILSTHYNCEIGNEAQCKKIDTEPSQPKMEDKPKDSSFPNSSDIDNTKPNTLPIAPKQIDVVSIARKACIKAFESDSEIVKKIKNFDKNLNLIKNNKDWLWFGLRLNVQRPPYCIFDISKIIDA